MIRGADGIFRVGVPSPDIGKVGWFVSIVNFICVFAIQFLGANVVPMDPPGSNRLPRGASMVW